ncbi:DUF6274 family protein [Streptomyces sp. NPDC014748]|uniref:DUF6274 family protein n=1 Tax=Streptomyces sp. NPDC014748 TaxID=3364905 RepID=UPI0036F89E93
MAASARHETRALLRAHLAAASSYRHFTYRCPVCHHLLRLALDSAPGTAPDAPEAASQPPAGLTAPEPPESVEPLESEQHPTTA